LGLGRDGANESSELRLRLRIGEVTRDKVEKLRDSKGTKDCLVLVTLGTEDAP
jgi:hypothetical protein